MKIKQTINIHFNSRQYTIKFDKKHHYIDKKHLNIFQVINCLMFHCIVATKIFVYILHN